jgi:hypothetical protein
MRFGKASVSDEMNPCLKKVVKVSGGMPATTLHSLITI